jgi:hypothetical protein
MPTHAPDERVIRTLARAWQKRPQTLPTHHALQAIPRAILLLLA